MAKFGRLVSRPRVVDAVQGVLQSLPRRGTGRLCGSGGSTDSSGMKRFSPGWRRAARWRWPATRMPSPTRSHSCVAKASIVARASARKAGTLLNLGHTFGHALEAATGYSDELLHGESVRSAACWFELSAALGHASEETDVAGRAPSRQCQPGRALRKSRTRPKPDELLAHEHDKKAQAADGHLAEASASLSPAMYRKMRCRRFSPWTE